MDKHKEISLTEPSKRRATWKYFEAILLGLTSATLYDFIKWCSSHPTVLDTLRTLLESLQMEAAHFGARSTPLTEDEKIRFDQIYAARAMLEEVLDKQEN